MISEIEISSIDLRYEGYRLKNPGIERELLSSILECGIRDPLEGVDIAGARILLNGFKRYRCALKAKISIVPYTTIGEDEAMGLIQLIRISNARGLSIIEQARMLDDLKTVHKMSVAEIAAYLSRSKSWVSVRTGIIDQMSEFVREKIFNGTFPVYSYMYTLRQFIRLNSVSKPEIDEFVNAVSGKNLSIRNIEQLAYGYFRGPEEFRQQIKEGNIFLLLDAGKNVPANPDDCNESERSFLNDLEIAQKYMLRVIQKSINKKFENNSFYAQVNLLSAGILSKMQIFTKTLNDIYDKSGQA